jgi:hypothetical protein
MPRLLTPEELEGRMDCFGDFDVTDEICLTRCGLNIACAQSQCETDESDLNPEDFPGIPEVHFD